MYQAIVFLPLARRDHRGPDRAGRRAGAPSGRLALPGRIMPRRITAHEHAHARHDHADVTTSRSSAEPAAAGSRAAELVTTLFLFIAMVLSWIAFVTSASGITTRAIVLFTWITSGDLKVDWALARRHADRGDAGRRHHRLGPRASLFDRLHGTRIRTGRASSAYLSLFTFAMLMLVTADNLVQLFFGWEGVGLASYLLIGFWYQKPEANAAAIKAFIVNRVGDFGFALGIFAVFMMTGAVDFDTVFAQAPSLDRQDHPFLRLERRRADADLPAAVHGRDGQVGAVPAAHLAARRHGRPDAGLRAHPCRHHGDGRRVHGGAAVAAVRAGAQCAGCS